MTIGGWITMLLSVGFVVSLFLWCIIKVLTTHQEPSHMAHVEPIEEDEADQR